MVNVVPPTTATHGGDYPPPNEEARLRAHTYSVLASLLSAPPTADTIHNLALIGVAPRDDGGDLAGAWAQLQRAAATADLQALDDEYHDLFIGLGRGEMVPFASWHITGFLMEQPLSDLRDDLKSLGIEADENQKDPEDHIAALCEAMALIIRADDIDESREREFFMRHIHAWGQEFFQQLQTARAAQFYRAVGLLGRRFVELEAQYLDIHTH